MKKLFASILILLLAFSGFAQITNINTGVTPDDNTGDPLWTAFTKVNSNFLYLSMEIINLEANTNFAAISATSLIVTNLQIVGGSTNLGVQASVSITTGSIVSTNTLSASSANVTTMTNAIEVVTSTNLTVNGTNIYQLITNYAPVSSVPPVPCFALFNANMTITPISGAGKIFSPNLQLGGTSVEAQVETPNVAGSIWLLMVNYETAIGSGTNVYFVGRTNGASAFTNVITGPVTASQFNVFLFTNTVTMTNGEGFDWIVTNNEVFGNITSALVSGYFSRIQ